MTKSKEISPEKTIEHVKKKEDELKRYKEDQQKRLSLFVIGKKDPNGYEITSILSRSSDWVIYEVKTPIVTESLRINIDTEIESDPKKIDDNFNKIRENFIKFKGVL